MLGRLDGRSVALAAGPPLRQLAVWLPDGLHWNLLSLFAEAREGIDRAAGEATLHGVGVDAWGVDYALLDGHGGVLGLPFHYRDDRTEGMIARATHAFPETSSTPSRASRRCPSTRSSS